MLTTMFEQCLYFNTNALARTVTRIWTEAYRPFELSPPQAFLLRTVLAKPGLLPRELAQELSVSRSTVTRFLDSLEKRDFVKRTPTGKDGREVQIYPTSSAQVIHQELDQIGAKLTKQMGKILGQEDVSQTVAKLREMQKTLDAS